MIPRDRKLAAGVSIRFAGSKARDRADTVWLMQNMDSLVWVGLKVIATAYASLTIANTIPASDVGAHANDWVDAVGYVLVPDSSQVRHSHGIPRVHQNTATGCRARYARTERA
jgi:hypothetical protein